MHCAYTANIHPLTQPDIWSAVAFDLFTLEQAAWAGFIILPDAFMLPHRWTLQTPMQIPHSCLGFRCFLQTGYVSKGINS